MASQAKVRFEHSEVINALRVFFKARTAFPPNVLRD
jgi:hypothetical protein